MVSKTRRADIRKQYRALRNAAGKTQLEVEQEARLLAGRYWKFENGFKEPSDDERSRLARVLKVTPEHIPSLNANVPQELAS